MAVVQPSMNGDIPNFSMGHKEEETFVGGNLQEEVMVVQLPLCSVITLQVQRYLAAG